MNHCSVFMLFYHGTALIVLKNHPMRHGKPQNPKLKRFISKELQIDSLNVEIGRAHCIRKSDKYEEHDNLKYRTSVAKFLGYEYKQTILKSIILNERTTTFPFVCQNLPIKTNSLS